MGIRMKSKKTLGMILCAILAGMLAPMSVKAESVNKSEYNLSIESTPTGLEKTYAKLHDSSLKAENFTLSMFDGYDAMIVVEDALESASEDLNKIEYLAMEVTLYEKDEEDDYYPVEERCGMTVICPVPEEMQTSAAEVQIIAVDNDGKIYRIPRTLTDVDGARCMKFDLADFPYFAFVLKTNGQFTAGIVPTATPIPDVILQPTKKPTATPKPTSTPSKAPTKAPTPTVKNTPAPTKAAVKPTTAPGKTESGKATPTPKAQSQKTPTKAVTASNSNSSSNQANRDKTPQTGDDFDRTGYAMMVGTASVVLIGLLYWNGRKRG